LTNIDIYYIASSIENSIIQYFFETEGKRKILKAVQYSKMKTKSNEMFYNLGFGDYNLESKNISDSENSNNGDVRIVFNTVLNTIPEFFRDNPDFPIYFQGSDSKDSFEEECRNKCSKNCTQICKNKNRRIRIYTYFLDKNYLNFLKDYMFYGFDEELKIFVEYVPKNKYTAILIYKKK
jgi:hypothetical protein